MNELVSLYRAERLTAYEENAKMTGLNSSKNFDKWLKGDEENLRLGYLEWRRGELEEFRDKRYPVKVPRLPERVLTNTECAKIWHFGLCRLPKKALFQLYSLVDTCRELCKAENHIRTPSGQYIEVETPLRTEADMVGEKVREITELSKYTAYAKIFSSSGVWKGKIKTRPLPEKDTLGFGGIPMDTRNSLLKKSRRKIRQEMQERQQNWRRGNEPPPVHS